MIKVETEGFCTGGPPLTRGRVRYSLGVLGAGRRGRIRRFSFSGMDFSRVPGRGDPEEG